MPITVFSNSLSGYNRREVDEYIANMNRAFVKSRRDYEKKIEILEAETAKLREELTKRGTAPSASSAAAISVPDASSYAYDELSADAAEKSRRYDEISRQVGEILMNANAEAAAIKREADEKVRLALTSAMSGIRTELTALIEKLGQMLDDAEAELSVSDGGDDEDGAEH